MLMYPKGMNGVKASGCDIAAQKIADGEQDVDDDHADQENGDHDLGAAQRP